MYITRIYINGFKRLADFELRLNEKLNVIVGDNETGKTSVLEAINLVLTGQYDGRRVDSVLDPYLFNSDMVTAYIAALRSGTNVNPPRILIEAYFDDNADPEVAVLKGRNNCKNEDCPGLKLSIDLDPEHVES